MNESYKLCLKLSFESFVSFLRVMCSMWFILLRLSHFLWSPRENPGGCDPLRSGMFWMVSRFSVSRNYYKPRKFIHWDCKKAQNVCHCKKISYRAVKEILFCRYFFSTHRLQLVVACELVTQQG